MINIYESFSMNMDDSYKFTAEYFIKNPVQEKDCRTHLVILGAGASRQAFLKGDRNGLLLPLMDDLVDTIGITDYLKSITNIDSSENFEEIYSRLVSNQEDKTIIKIIEDKIYKHFAKMKLPDCPTLYDHLLLSLRNNDLKVVIDKLKQDVLSI